jgi:hypothetical protein
LSAAEAAPQPIASTAAAVTIAFRIQFSDRRRSDLVATLSRARRRRVRRSALRRPPWQDEEAPQPCAAEIPADHPIVGFTRTGKSCRQGTTMAVRFIIIWLVLAALSGWGAWFVARAPRRALWVRIGVAAALLVGFAAAFWMYGAELEKNLGSVILYFLVWGSVFGLSAACAGIVLGTLIALLIG